MSMKSTRRKNITLSEMNRITLEFYARTLKLPKIEGESQKHLQDRVTCAILLKTWKDSDALMKRLASRKDLKFGRGLEIRAPIVFRKLGVKK